MAHYFVLNFMLLNLVLAVVYLEYTEGLKRRTLTYFLNRAACLRAAYAQMTDHEPEYSSNDKARRPSLHQVSKCGVKAFDAPPVSTP